MGGESMRAQTFVLFFALAVASPGCGEDVFVADDLTGVELTVAYSDELALDQLVFVVVRADGSILVAPQPRPAVPSPLRSGSSTVVILLPDALADREISIRIDAMSAGELVASTAADVILTAQVLTDIRVELVALMVCGDGLTSAPFEECDDGNRKDDDGCDGHCDVERGYVCHDDEGPSVCHKACGEDDAD